MPMTIEEIIKRLGGPEQAARLTGVSTEAVRKWRQARAIPPKHWTVVLRETGLSLSDLQPATESDRPEPPMTAPSPTVPAERPPAATAALILADGTVLWGRGFGAHGEAASAIGEICFSTGMTGYQETLTDPSFAGQIITFTFPHIGNVGTTPEDDEAARVAARALVVKEDLTAPANWRSVESLDAWLKARGIPGICGIDTRALTRRIRDGGPQTAIVAYPADGRIDIAALQAQARAWPGLEGMDLAREVTCAKPYAWDEGVWHWPHGTVPLPAKRRRVVAVDYGAKRNILRCLSSAGCEVIVVPATATAEEILSHDPAGVFLSNGPGDPAATASYAVPAIRGVLDAGKPVFGICLGHQLLALTLGAKTYKLERGHRGANQPVKDLATGKVEITSQNHGFAVDDKTLPDGVRATHISLFDGSNEGIASDRYPAFSVQYHPESSPGPSDSRYLFDRFVALIDSLSPTA
ncbi:glutamine-hydrolyzing carbamoyl-phosphate synthase small subunit [Gluconacetobacter entanii]|uniref:glutamine-hydrolyzing carbamoyl-phosphate synthase small subunit n=2 Tax=Gluconacetobacter entanii TaxID=108528 RepID=UPI002236756E|nr:glutamine-hydrolyzing carbamoyl-phosphate synthase small subunit [Gluconacetobacter entanii]MCW4579405.1 glutamine-hydrolyzing carbamoyl-phosphate synthase small subunit [Gluconacetobacter entanii]MCW4582793.1 glutamine-hydrolyzing carbamoyl-phosphate synthase small subunit [Gluconacetobacter entanii]MCW4586206.1 glutamine-hydrolyzing carbamoyl-phosphate synthase small subunit [Gluconacetobacter entanii]